MEKLSTRGLFCSRLGRLTRSRNAAEARGFAVHVSLAPDPLLHAFLPLGRSPCSRSAAEAFDVAFFVFRAGRMHVPSHGQSRSAQTQWVFCRRYGPLWCSVQPRENEPRKTRKPRKRKQPVFVRNAYKSSANNWRKRLAGTPQVMMLRFFPPWLNSPIWDV